MSLDKGGKGSLDKANTPKAVPVSIIVDGTDPNHVTLYDRTGQIIADYGTGATAAIQAALNAYSDVFLREATYNITASLTANLNNHLHGAGRKTILSSTTIANLILVGDAVNNVEIDHLALTTSFSGATGILTLSEFSAGHKIVSTYIHEVYISDTSAGNNVGIKFYAANACGIVFTKIENCEILNAHIGIDFVADAGANNWINGTIISKTYISGWDTGQAAILIENGVSATYGTNYSVIEDNELDQTSAGATSGISITGYAYGTQMRNNQFWKDGAGALVAYNIGANANLTNIEGGHIEGGTITDAGVKTAIRDIVDYNPKGVIATPYSAAAGNLDDTAKAQAFPTTATNYTVTMSPKLVIIGGGTITSVNIDGVATGQSGAASPATAYRLEPGQVWNVVWTVQPTINGVRAQ